MVCDPSRRDGAAAAGAGRRGGRDAGHGRRGHASPTAAAAEAPTFATVPRAADDLAAILYTSGTTGRSKGAMLTHAQPRLQRRDAGRGLALHRRRRAASTPCRSSTPTACSSPPTSRCSPAARMIFLPRSTPTQILAPAAARHRDDGRADLLYPPARSIPASPARRRPHMRLFTSGSAPLLAETHRALAGAHRPRHPRALRHDRDQHEHLQPL